MSRNSKFIKPAAIALIEVALALVTTTQAADRMCDADGQRTLSLCN